MIGLFNDSFPPVMDGVAVCVYNYARHLTLLGREACVITPEVPSERKEEIFKVYCYPSFPVPFKKPYRFGLNLLSSDMLRGIKDIPFELLHAHSPFSAGRIAKQLAVKRNIPLVATFHSKFRYDFERVFHSKLVVDLIIKHIIAFYEGADEVWVPQQAVLETLYEYGYRGKEPFVIPNGNDLIERTDGEKLRKELREALGITPETPILLFVGQQIREKNIPFILQSLRLLGDMPYQMLSVGEGYGMKEFAKLAADLGIGDRVSFVGPIYERERLAAYYAAADLFLFPSLYDNAPLVLREAAAMCTPGLLIAGSTSSAVIEDGVNGFLTKEDQTEYAAAIRRILADRENLLAVSERAREMLARSWQDIAQDVQERYDTIIDLKNCAKG